MKKCLSALLALATICTILTGCGSSNTDTGMMTTEPVEMESIETTILPETEPALMGNWTLEECKNSTGIFIAHEDGSFTKFYGGGYLNNDSMYYDQGMYISNAILDLNPPISKEDKLVLFCDTQYSLKMVPVNWEIGVLYSKLEDGTRGYTRATPYLDGVYFLTQYENHQTVQNNNILYIDGISADEYPFEIVEGGPKNTAGAGFPKGATVKLGTKNGSTLVEEEYEVSATYFDCHVKSSLGSSSDDEHYLYSTPTSDGYAVIDIYDGPDDTEISSGTYVMILRMGNSYIAHLINWENS